ncbi:hypothetical protein RUM43_003974 [Polyplax serrata]|uniref:Deoxyribonuclease TATDN1 n=1 Tax=Polyplax serrata TaxID=468196 RepID=A0AAN8P3A4_POLSC
MSKPKLCGFIDIGANLVDSMFSGIYNGSQKHAPDLEHVLNRSWENGLKKIIITGTSLSESQAALDIARTKDRLFCTVGCHPTNCNEIGMAEDGNAYLQSLVQLCKENKEKVVALGEFGLDYDRLHFCKKEEQLKGFEDQLVAFEGIKLPLFLHCRNAADDLISILTNHRHQFVGGVVHSFDGSAEEAKKILDLGLHIGINGCSLKTEENLQVLKTLPSEKLLVETDSPWCEVKASHAGYKYVTTKFSAVKKEKWEVEKLVKGRNEPCNIIQILEIIAAVKEENIESLAETICNNTEKLFFS